jgi:hypothetical protein
VDEVIASRQAWRSGTLHASAALMPESSGEAEPALQRADWVLPAELPLEAPLLQAIGPPHNYIGLPSEPSQKRVSQLMTSNVTTAASGGMDSGGGRKGNTVPEASGVWESDKVGPIADTASNGWCGGVAMLALAC